MISMLPRRMSRWFNAHCAHVFEPAPRRRLGGSDDFGRISATDITPEVGKPIPGGFAPRESTGVLDPLQARACVIEGAGKTVAVVGVDAVSLRFDTIEKARRMIGAKGGPPERNVIVAASHTHSGGPSNDVLGTGSDEAYCEGLAAKIAEAVLAAQRA